MICILQLRNRVPILLQLLRLGIGSAPSNPPNNPYPQWPISEARARSAIIRQLRKAHRGASSWPATCAYPVAMGESLGTVPNSLASPKTAASRPTSSDALRLAEYAATLRRPQAPQKSELDPRPTSGQISGLRG